MVSRREFDTLARRVDQIDAGGTRGIGALQQMVTSLSAQIADVKASQAEHAASHIAEERFRDANRGANTRWAVAQLIALAVLIVSVLALIFTR